MIAICTSALSRHLNFYHKHLRQEMAAQFQDAKKIWCGDGQGVLHLTEAPEIKIRVRSGDKIWQAEKIVTFQLICQFLRPFLYLLHPQGFRPTDEIRLHVMKFRRLMVSAICVLWQPLLQAAVKKGTIIAAGV